MTAKAFFQSDIQRQFERESDDACGKEIETGVAAIKSQQQTKRKIQVSITAVRNQSGGCCDTVCGAAR